MNRVVRHQRQIGAVVPAGVSAGMLRLLFDAHKNRDHQKYATAFTSNGQQTVCKY